MKFHLSRTNNYSLLQGDRLDEEREIDTLEGLLELIREFEESIIISCPILQDNKIYYPIEIYDGYRE